MHTHSALATVASIFTVGCASARPMTAAPPSASPEPTPRASATVALLVHDPTDLEARLAMLLRAALAARGIDAVWSPSAAGARGLVVDVFVLNRQRTDERVQAHDVATRPGSGFGLVGGSDDPARLPEQHVSASEPFDFGRVFTQTDLRIIVTASLRQVGVARPLARWSDEEGTLVRRDDGAAPMANPWQAVYAAVAEQLADQVAAALVQARARPPQSSSRQ
jgi:hypothetical protein